MTNGRGDFSKYRALLEAKQTDLLKVQVLRRRDEITIEKSADELDEVQRAAERDWAVRNLDRESSLLRSVQAALRRIREGTFGVCVHCEEDIGPKRLEAVPWAPFCIRCQEAADRNELDAMESLQSSWRLQDAA